MNPLKISAATIGLAAGLLITASPAVADVYPDDRPCITRNEWEAVKLGWTKHKVVNEFDSSSDFSLISTDWLGHTHMESWWETPGRCSDGKDIKLYFVEDDWGRWITESKCWPGDGCLWSH